MIGFDPSEKLKGHDRQRVIHDPVPIAVERGIKGRALTAEPMKAAVQQQQDAE